jgi:ribosomal protein S4
MNKLKPRNKICFQNYKNYIYIKKNKLQKLKKKKWFFIKKIKKNKKINIPENRKIFFKQRLLEKQQFKNFYGCLAEYKIKKIIKKSKKKKEILKEFISIIESNLDINIVRFKKAKSIFHAKQLINHKKIKINNNLINKSNYMLNFGDIITLRK